MTRSEKKIQGRLPAPLFFGPPDKQTLDLATKPLENRLLIFVLQKEKE
jgi:hypothetical protein